MTAQIRQKIIDFLVDDFDKSKFNMIAGGALSLIGHPLYYFIYSFWLTQPYDSPFLRFTSSIISIPLFYVLRYPSKYKPWITLYWYFWVMFILPLTFTFIMLMNNVSTLWLIAETMMVFLTILFISSTLVVLVVLFVGCLTAYLCFVYYSNIPITGISATNLIEYLMLLPLAISCGSLFIFSAKKGESEKRKSAMLQLSASIAHELRNPLGAINLISNMVIDVLKSKSLSHEEKISQTLEYKQNILSLTKSANDIINIILSDISQKPITAEDFSYLTPSQIVPQVLAGYGYKNEAEKTKVWLLLPDAGSAEDFVVKAIPDRLTFILYNLLKNALYYLKDYPDSIVTIGTERRVIAGVTYNVIYVFDTGPGIPPQVIDRLFDDFFTSGKKEGTGLGLAFCRRNMRIFAGEVICESSFGGKVGFAGGGNGSVVDVGNVANLRSGPQQVELQTGGNWTKFSLLFPVLSEGEVAAAGSKSNTHQQLGSPEQYRAYLKGKSALLADDQELNLKITTRRLESLGMKVVAVADGQELVDAYYNRGKNVASGGGANGSNSPSNNDNPNNFDIIITDINMPELRGDEASKIIRQTNKTIPIIALSGDGQEKDLAGFFAAGMTDCFVKGNDPELLVRILASYLAECRITSKELPNDTCGK